MKGLMDMVQIDRSALNRALSKAIAYKNCGNQRKAETWSIELIRLLDTMDILVQSRLDGNKLD